MHTFRCDVGGQQRSIADTWGESPFSRRETDNWFGCDQRQGRGSGETPQKMHTIIWTIWIVRLLVLLSEWVNFYRQTVRNSSWGDGQSGAGELGEAGGADQSVSALIKTLNYGWKSLSEEGKSR